MPMGSCLPVSCAFGLIFIHVATLTTLVPTCPNECLCLSQTQVLCNTGDLREIPLKLLPPTVEHLSLTRNHFAVLKSDSFAGLKSLKKLFLDGNNITFIKPFAFRGTRNLRELSIQHTPLEAVNQFAFSGLQNLSIINLGHNKIRRVEPYAFAGTSFVRLLVLTNNPLTKIDSNAFSGLTNVERISLPSGIRTLEPDFANGLDTIGYIKLAFMDLSALKRGVFRGLTNVNVLSIQESDLGNIDGDAFNEMNNVKTLNFLNNKIDSIEWLNFTYEQKVNHLKFQGNHILEVPKSDTLLIEVEKLTVISNHFPCDCNLHTLLNGPLANDSVRDFMSKNYCISPIEYNGMLMSNIDLDSLGRCQEEVTRENLEAAKDVASNSAKLCFSENLVLFTILFWFT